MHKIDFAKLEGLWNQEWVLELVWQLDERYVKREELPPLIFEEPEPQTRLSGTMEQEVQPKAKCEHPCHGLDPVSMIVVAKMLSECPMCGLPLTGKEKKP